MTAAPFQLVPAGDSALIVEFEARIDPIINARAIRLAERLQAAAHPGLLDVVPTFRSVAVYFDPLRTDARALERLIEDAASESADAVAQAREPVRVPVCYGGDLGPDLPGVASLAGLSEDEVIAIHAGTVYRVFMIGFTPGFAYMGLVDKRISMPRHRTPRVRVPAGSVAIAGVQTGIYPSASPGGWQLIGRTTVKPFDPSRSEPFLMKPGDAVQFIPIDRRTYDDACREPTAQ